jgi:DNA gyrase/topoisomerase IV subunit A
MKEFAMYTIENRAIPSAVDGLKPVQRFYLYSSIVNSSKEFKKVSAISGIISDYGYNHGETSAAGAGQLMAADWNNNIRLVEGRGSFGTRQIQAAGAARYVYTRLHANFGKYIKDINLSPEHDDPEHMPPKYYIPVIPLVLSNGVKGIATGFATTILPRGEADIIKACSDYVKRGKIAKRLPITFPDFKGTTSYDAVADRFLSRGLYERPSNTKILITEIPYGYDRETYVKILDKLEDDNNIVDYEDQCSTNGFQFEIKLKNSVAKTLNTDAKIVKMFKLEKTYAENLTVIDAEGNLKEYHDERDLIADFVNFKMVVLDSRIANKLIECNETLRWLDIKREFIEAVLDDNISFKGKTKVKVVAQIKNETEAKTNEDCDRLLRLNIMTLTKEMVDELKKQIANVKIDAKYWKTTSAKEQFLGDLKF